MRGIAFLFVGAVLVAIALLVYLLVASASIALGWWLFVGAALLLLAALLLFVAYEREAEEQAGLGQ